MAEELLPGHCPTAGEGAEDQAPGLEMLGPPGIEAPTGSKGQCSCG